MSNSFLLWILLDAPSTLDWLDVILVPLLLAFLAHFYWRRQKKIENQLKRIETQYASKLESAKAVWALLEYLTERENPKSIIVNRGDKEKTITYLRMDRAIEFMELVPKIFYQEGHGVYMTDLVERDLYEVRDKCYQVVESILRAYYKKSGKALPDLEEGFFDLVGQLPSQKGRITNPKVISFFREKAERLKGFLRNQLTENKEEK